MRSVTDGGKSGREQRCKKKLCVNQKALEIRLLFSFLVSSHGYHYNTVLLLLIQIP